MLDQVTGSLPEPHYMYFLPVHSKAAAALTPHCTNRMHFTKNPKHLRSIISLKIFYRQDRFTFFTVHYIITGRQTERQSRGNSFRATSPSICASTTTPQTKKRKVQSLANVAVTFFAISSTLPQSCAARAFPPPATIQGIKGFFTFSQCRE